MRVDREVSKVYSKSKTTLPESSLYIPPLLLYLCYAAAVGVSGCISRVAPYPVSHINVSKRTFGTRRASRPKVMAQKERQIRA